MSPPLDPPWYAPPADPQLRKAYDDKVAAVLVNADTGDARRAEALLQMSLDQQRAQLAGEQKSFEETLSALRTHALAAVDRARDTAKYVQTASVAAAGLYTGLLGFVFGFDEGATALPIRAVIPTVFFGSSIAFSTWYLAFLPDRAKFVPWQTPNSNPRASAKLHLKTVGTVVSASVSQRAWSMRAAVLSLLLATVFLPVAFVGAPRGVLADIGMSVFGPSADAAQQVSTASETHWPSPSSVGSDTLSLELYRRQLDAFETSIAPQPSAPSTWWDYELLVLAFFLLLIVLVVAASTGEPKEAKEALGDGGRARGDGGP